MSIWPEKKEKKVAECFTDGYNQACNDHLTARKKALEELSVGRIKKIVDSILNIGYKKRVYQAEDLAKSIHEEIKRVLEVEE